MKCSPVLLATATSAAEPTSRAVEVIRGLLQCAEYARSILRAWEPEMGDAIIQSPLELRMARQRLLDREDPARYTAVISESCLMNGSVTGTR